MIDISIEKDFNSILFKKLDLSKKNKISIAIDTSASLIETATRKALKIIENAIQDKDVELNVWCFDMTVQLDSEKTFTIKNMQDLEKYEFLGFGGSQLDDSFFYLNKNHYDSDLHIVITDGLLNPYEGTVIPNDLVYIITKPEYGYSHLNNGRCFPLD